MNPAVNILNKLNNMNLNFNNNTNNNNNNFINNNINNNNNFINNNINNNNNFINNNINNNFVNNNNINNNFINNNNINNTNNFINNNNINNNNNFINNNNINNNNNNNFFNNNNNINMNMMQQMLINSGMFFGQDIFASKNCYEVKHIDNIEIDLNIHLNEQKVVSIKFSQDKKVSELIRKIKTDYKINNISKLMVKGKPLVNTLSLAENNLPSGTNIHILLSEDANDDKKGYNKKINMIFKLDKPNQFNDDNNNINLNYISKVCFLKEIVSRLSDENIEKLPENISIILKLLKKGKIENLEKLGNESKDTLEKIRLTNLLNLAHFIDNKIDSTQLDNIINLLNKEDLEAIKIFKNNLNKINDKIIMFNENFDLARRKSIFEYSLVALEIANRPDIETYNNNFKNCPNKKEIILFQGTPEENAYNILRNHFSFYPKNILGNGVYLSSSIDLSYIHSRDSIDNPEKLPEVGEEISIIVSSVFYNNKKIKIVSDNKCSPKKNEINTALVDGKMNPFKKLDESKFFSREYIIGDTSQIFPFMNIKVKRSEYCVIWRDNNLSPNPVYKDEYDEKFKAFLKIRLEYISQYAKFNIYPCQTTKEALELVRKKKYNKIILMSNVGTDLGGKAFVDEARKIIGNDVITLFLAFLEKHLKWITNYNNSLFSNIEEFHEQYLDCFTGDINSTKQNILALKHSIEDYYKVKFKFDDKFLDFPNFKEEGEFDDLSFKF